MAALVKYCSMQEHCEYDIMEKTKQFGLNSADAQEILNYLTDNNFVNNTRYAIAFANDKFRFNKWGKIKISYALKQKHLRTDIIEQALSKIDDEAYFATLKSEISKKTKSLKQTDAYSKKAALFRFASSRGFETSLIYKIIGSLD